MPHVFSANQIKRGKSTPSSTPRPGTKSRQLWDFLYLHKGEWVEFAPTDFGYTASRIGSTVEHFRNRCGLDIRCEGRGRGHKNYCRWLFAGEWEGKIYIDHVIARQK